MSLLSQDEKQSSREDLLEFYFESSSAKRGELFIDTARAAELCDCNPRTILYWIESGLVRAVRPGRKAYQIELASLKTFIKRQVPDEAAA